VQGDLARAMALYEQSLAINEALKDLQGKSATLGAIANVHMARQDWGAAAEVLNQALDLNRRLGDPSGMAFNTVKLGQVAQAQGDAEVAIARYREGLAIFERLGMQREAQQVRELIASLAHLASPSLSEAIAAWTHDVSDDQSRLQALLPLLNRIAGMVVQTGRANDSDAAEQLAQALIPLRMALRDWAIAAELPPFNAFFGCLQALLRGEAQQLARLRTGLDEGLGTALAEVERRLAADETTLRNDARNQSVTTDSLSDEDAAQIAMWVPGATAAEQEPDLPPAVQAALEAGDQAAFDAALTTLPDEEREPVLRALAERAAAQFRQLPPDQQAELQRQARAQQIAATAEQAAAATRDALADDDPTARAELAAKLADAAAYYAEGETPGSDYDQLTNFLRACTALLRGEPPPPLPERYARLLAELNEGDASV
jgi:hypothetical protein